MSFDDSESAGNEPKKGAPGAGRYIAIAAVAAAIAVIVVIVVATSGPNTKSDDAANGTSTSGSASTTSSVTSSATLPSPSTSAPNTGNSSIPMPSSSVSVPPPPAPTTVPPSAGNVSDQPALPSISGAEVFVTSAVSSPSTQTIEVSASVGGVTTEDGTCTATASSAGDTATASTPAVFDGRGMSCGSISIPMQGKPGGNWQVVVTFESSGGTAKSAATSVVVK